MAPRRRTPRTGGASPVSGKRSPPGALMDSGTDSGEEHQEPSNSRKRRSPKRDLDPLLAEIAVIVKRIRVAKRMTTKEVATKAEVEVQTIFGAEAGLQNLTLTTFAKLARGLGEQPVELLPPLEKPADAVEAPPKAPAEAPVQAPAEPVGELRRMEDLDTVLEEIHRLSQLALAMRTRSIIPR